MEKTYAIYCSKILSIMPGIKNIITDEKNANVSIEQKSGIGNFVTSVDKKIEEYIIANLMKLFPNSQIISEESADEIKENKIDGLKFIVDPLDGTNNYTNGWPYVVSIGIIDDNELVSGIIYDVLSNKIYTGIKDIGVTECNINDISKQKRVITPTYLQKEIKKSVITHDNPYGEKAYEITRKMVDELYYEGASIKIIGPTALHVLNTALGKENRPMDYSAGTWHTEVRSWDLAAATCILRELGGEIIGKDGKPLSTEILSSPTEKISFIASGSEVLRTALYEKYKSAEEKANLRKS